MNIAFVTPEFVTEIGYDGGLANYLYKISKSLIKRGHNIYIIVISEDDEIFLYEDINVIRVTHKSYVLRIYQKLFFGKFYAPVKWLVQSQKLNNALKKLNAKITLDIVQFASMEATGFFASSVVPKVGRISSYKPLNENAYERKMGFVTKTLNYLEMMALKKMDGVFGPSKITANIVSQKIQKPVKVIESPVFQKNTYNIQVYNDSLKDKKYLLFFGSLSLLKGIKEIGDIIYKVLSEFPDIFFVFVGKDRGDLLGKPMMDYIWRKAAEKRGRCLFLGSMEQEFLQPIIAKSTAVVLPSRMDNFPNTCIEAMLLGKIVIGTDGASYEQLIEDGRNGYLCKIKDPFSLLQSIRKVLSLDEEEKRKISKNAQSTVKRLSPTIIAEEMEYYYKEIISE